MPRFFIDKNNIKDKTAVISGTDVNHIKNVLRMNEGEELILCDMEGTDLYCAISSMDEKSITCNILNTWRSYSELDTKLYLFQSLAKGDKMDTVVQKAVELGAYAVIPFSSERSVVRLEDKKAADRVKRWQSISEAAAKQSGRGIIPEVFKIITFDEALKMAEDLSVSLIPYEKAEGMDEARKAVLDIKGKESAGIFIGPEGGFSENEIEKAVSKGLKPISLGRRILRTETAGAAILSVIGFLLEE